MQRLEGLKLFIISEDNMKKIMRGLSFADYFDFFDDNFDRIGNLKIDENALDEPEIPDPEDIIEAEEQQDEEWEDEEENFIF